MLMLHFLEELAEDLPLKAIPAPVAQFNIGLPMKFEAMIRYLS